MRFREKSVLFIATGCFIGKVPYAPGTLGTLAGIPLCFILSCMNLWIAVISIIVFIITAIWLSGSAENILKAKDPGSIVIDEIAGIMVALAGIPFHPVYVGLAFIIFRILDICKPFPINRMEAKFSGGKGIVFDDVAAGLMTHAIVRLAMISAGLFHLGNI